jgi:hypothetical protein
MLLSLPPRLGAPIWVGKGEPVPGEGGEPFVGDVVVVEVGVRAGPAGPVVGAAVPLDGAAPPPPDNGVVGGTVPVGSGRGGIDGRLGMVNPRAPVTRVVAPVIVGRRELGPEASDDWVATPVTTTVAWWVAPFDTTGSPVKAAFGGSLAPLHRSTAPTTGPVGAGTTADGVEGEVPDDAWRCNRSGQFEAVYVLATARFGGDWAREPEDAAAAVAESATMVTAPMVVGRCHHPGVLRLFATMSECST